MTQDFKLKGKSFIVLEQNSKGEIVDIRRFKVCSVSHFHALCGKWQRYFTIQRHMITHFTYRDYDDAFLFVATPDPHYNDLL